MGQPLLRPGLLRPAAQHLRESKKPRVDPNVKQRRYPAAHDRLHDPSRDAAGAMGPNDSRQDQARQVQVRSQGGGVHRHVHLRQMQIEEMHVLPAADALGGRAHDHLRHLFAVRRAVEMLRHIYF